MGRILWMVPPQALEQLYALSVAQNERRWAHGGTCRNSAGHLRKIWGYSICHPSVVNGWAGFFCIISAPIWSKVSKRIISHISPTIGTSRNLRFDLQKSAPSRLQVGPVFGVKIGNSPKVQGKPTSKHKKPISIGFSPCDPPDDVQGVLSSLAFLLLLTVPNTSTSSTSCLSGKQTVCNGKSTIEFNVWNLHL